MKAKSYLDKRTELLPGTKASLFVTDGWRGGEVCVVCVCESAGVQTTCKEYLSLYT